MRLRRRGLVCREAVELVTDYLDGALSRSEKARLERHLRGCANCTEYLSQIRATVTAAGRVDPESLTPEVEAQLVGLYRAWRPSKD
jgi:anti-sigma factor RsiW